MKSYSPLDEIGKVKSKVFQSVTPLLDGEGLKELFCGHTTRERVYGIKTLMQLWLHQSAVGCSCREAVAWGIANGLVPKFASPKTAAYCNSRTRVASEPVYRLMTLVGSGIEASADKRRRPFGRDVIVVDGSSVQLPDTPANSAEYTYQARQKPGCGQPIMSIAVLMGLGSGAVLAMSECGELGRERAMFRNLWPSLKEGQIILGDCGFCSYGEFAKLLETGVDVVMCQRPDYLDNKKKIEIGTGDYTVIWERRSQKLKWTDHEKLPEHLVVRAIEFTTTSGNGESVRRVIFTTLLDRKKYTRGKLIKLYHRRWEIELSFDDIKTEMGMDLLKCKTPERCRAEIYMCLIAYNIIRGVMLDAALNAGLTPRDISFKGTMQRLDIYLRRDSFNGNPKEKYRMLLKHLADDKLVKRPGRYEPRMRKRRTKNYSFLTKPRNSFKHAVCTP